MGVKSQVVPSAAVWMMLLENSDRVLRDVVRPEWVTRLVKLGYCLNLIEIQVYLGRDEKLILE